MAWQTKLRHRGAGVGVGLGGGVERPPRDMNILLAENIMCTPKIREKKKHRWWILERECCWKTRRATTPS